MRLREWEREVLEAAGCSWVLERMALVTIWTLKNGEWARTLVDPATLPRIPEPVVEEPDEVPQTDYQALAASAREREADKLEWEKRQRAIDLRSLMWRISVRERDRRHGVRDLVLKRVSDHDWIEGMFSVYARGGSRLL